MSVPDVHFHGLTKIHARRIMKTMKIYRSFRLEMSAPGCSRQLKKDRKNNGNREKNEGEHT